MPGPRNNKKPKSSARKKQNNVKRAANTSRSPLPTTATTPTTIVTVATPPTKLPSPAIPPSLPILSFLHDPGTGPRVLNMSMFLQSPFASKPSLDDPLCAEFAQEEVLEMLMGVLPEELALILWYNKSRVGGRVCPTCGRMYKLGDTLAAHAILNGKDESERWEVKQTEQLRCEQELSGLCSTLCFIAASSGFPDQIIRSIWGRSAEQLDDTTWSAMQNTTHALDVLVKMTRIQDLGLGQIYFPNQEFDD